MLNNIHRLRRYKCYLCSALLLLSFASIGGVNAKVSEPLTLEKAAQLTLSRHPQLQVFQWRNQALAGQRLSVDQSPSYDIGFEAENVLGTGEYSGVDAVELTLALSSFIELGDKRLARTTVVDTSFAHVEAQKKAAGLDLLGEVTQTFITTLSLQEKQQLAESAIALAQATYQQVNQRVRQGSASQADGLRAKAALANARLNAAELASRYNSSKVILASYWGSYQPDFLSLSGDLFAFKSVESFEALYQRIETTPAIEVYANEQRVREAEWQLARSQSSSDIRWQIGVKHFEVSGDNALTLGFSMPLFAGQRNSGNVQAANSAINQVSAQKDAALLALRVRLFKAYSSRQQQFEAVTHLREEIIPILSESLTHTQKAYQKGAYRYADWVSAQQELLNARLALIEAATSVLLNQALIEQLTAQALEQD
ncbi:TolC family protein [Shewanella sp. OMA3-2]|uniref:TolC family protein n=1 Tax=Shewanella sp. OMA3-2 TaxID=2908650 RepID=UPI001F25C240|nr:TolC family protein [Shewanella sp. OMA3-2]UJF21819.1 TolC family protein [Shewanella sp. OMA3-2]